MSLLNLCKTLPSPLTVADYKHSIIHYDNAHQALRPNQGQNLIPCEAGRSNAATGCPAGRRQAASKAAPLFPSSWGRWREREREGDWSHFQIIDAWCQGVSDEYEGECHGKPVAQVRPPRRKKKARFVDARQPSLGSIDGSSPVMEFRPRSGVLG